MAAISNGLSRAQFLRMVGGLATGAGAAGLLSACGDGSSGDGSATLTVVGVADEKAPLDLLTKAYTDSGAKVTFKTSYAPTDQVQTSVRTQLNGGNAPDIHVLYPGSGSAMSTGDIGRTPGLLADLSGQSWTSLIPANLKSSFSYDGKVHLFSSGLTVIGVIYNKSVFSAAGVQIPKTYNDLITVCETLKKAGKVPFALGAQTPWVTQLVTYAFVASNVYRDTPDFDDQMLAGKATFLDSGWKQSMTQYMDLRDRGFFNDNPNGTTLEQSTAMVANGQAAMAVQVAPLLPAFRDAAKNKDDISMFPFPSADTEDKVFTWGGANVGIGVHEKSKNKDAALKFIEFLGQQENINKWCEAVAGIPIKRDASSKVDPALESFLPLLDGGRVAPVGQRWPNAEVQPTHFSVIQELLGKKITVDDALKKMDEVYKKAA
ncbi:ABC transporter substrate-binding protein [Actinoplanes sp. NPDC051513]|uniref:ABC transporter substrate-binding protein n=1 Tax=Actinoplanes sp. NPDC051513 TaxID=3363908 RepID=UPI0037A7B796